KSLSHQALLAQPVWTRTARKNRSVHVVREVCLATLALRAAASGVQNANAFWRALPRSKMASKIALMG
ncbi:hypothetical protein AIZ23_24600, partial [Salmonella enterica subsp. enterica serovar Typhimurium]